MDKEYYSWTEFEEDMKKMIGRIRESGAKLHSVWGPPRGGLVPAVILSHALKIPLEKYCPSFEELMMRNILIVDDIADTGKTLEQFRNHSFIVTLYYHQQSIVIPDIWLREKLDRWIIFPWELKT